MPTVTLESTIKKITVGQSIVQNTGENDSIKFNTDADPPSSPQQAEMWWNATEETLDLKQDGATLQLGQEVQWPVFNNTGVQIDDGTMVMATGTIGATGRITIAPMDGTDPAMAKYILGMATHDIGNNSNGKVTAFGKVRGLDTSAWNDGDILWISPTNAGELVNAEPAHNLIGMPVAFVVNSSATQGVLSVRVTPINEHIWVESSTSTTDNAIPRFDGTVGKSVQNSGVTIDDNNRVSGAGIGANSQTGTTYELALTDAGKLVTLNNASPIALTIPANASVAFPVDTVINLLQLGAGQVTVGITSDTLNSSGSATKLTGQYSAATLVKVDTTTWVLFGDITT